MIRDTPERRAELRRRAAIVIAVGVLQAVAFMVGLAALWHLGITRFR